MCWILRKDVVDCIYEMMAKILGCGRVSYVKWDMNRSITECWSPSLPADRQARCSTAIFWAFTVCMSGSQRISHGAL